MVYKTKHVKPAITDYDVIVIGTGSGGSVGAHILNQQGKKIAVVEQENIGGECPNYGCIPTKALLQAAETIEVIERANSFGIKVKDAKLDYKALKNWKDKSVHNTGTWNGEASYKEDGVAVLKGHSHFINPWTLSVHGKRFTAKKFLIASGTHDFVPPIPGLEDTGYIGYREALDFTSPPKSLFVIGGGAIGCEFTQIFSTFGVQVHIAEYAERLLAKEDPEIGDLTQALFEQKGVKVHVESKVIKVAKKGAQKVVTIETHGKKRHITVDQIMLAAGKIPNTDLGLENAGVDYDKRRGILVNKEMRTSAKHIYAAGDVTGGYMFTHTANYESRIAAMNMFSSIVHLADYRAVPRCVFISPEVAAVGATEAELKKDGIEYQVASTPTGWLGRANTSQQDTGFVKILANKKGVILGASIVAPRAGEMIHELVLATQYRMKASKIEWTIHAFPTWSQAVRVAASKIVCR